MLPWRQAASLILLGSRQSTMVHGQSRFDYATLLLKRSPNMRFAPDISAFAGGKLDACDLSLDWPKYLSSSIDLERFSKPTARIYKDIDHPYPGLAFRLCAIRETFEETGLLLAKSRSAPSSRYATIATLSTSLVDSWREKIRADASQFMAMCQEIQMEPDVHSLLEWSQYLAPAIAKSRFDTLFYLATLPDTYPCAIAADDHETASADWLEPDVIMHAYRQGSINFLPPQVYELSRLANFRKLTQAIDYLHAQANQADYSVERMLGICYKLPEAMLVLMPGDDCYPSDGSFATPILTSTRTLKEFDSRVQNRLIMMLQGKNRTWQVQYRNEGEKKNGHARIQPLTDGWEK